MAELLALGCVLDSVALRLPSEISPLLSRSQYGLWITRNKRRKKFLQKWSILSSFNLHRPLSPESDSKKKKNSHGHMVPQAQWCLFNSLLLDYAGNDDRQIKRHCGYQNRADHSFVRPCGDSASYCQWSTSLYLTRETDRALFSLSEPHCFLSSPIIIVIVIIKFNFLSFHY